MWHRNMRIFLILFHLQEIDGKAFLLLKSELMLKYMGLKLGHVVKLCSLIDRLKAQWTKWCRDKETSTTVKPTGQQLHSHKAPFTIWQRDKSWYKQSVDKHNAELRKTAPAAKISCQPPPPKYGQKWQFHRIFLDTVLKIIFSTKKIISIVRINIWICVLS